LCREPLVITSGFRTVIDEQLRRLGRQLNPSTEIDSVEAIRRMVLRGQATTIMPASTFRDDIQAGKVDGFRIANTNLHRLLAIALPLSGRATSAIQQVADVLARQFSSLSDEGVFRLAQRQRPVRSRAGQAR
jgi:DNA-binding transcriptional LysR family regulator